MKTDGWNGGNVRTCYGTLLAEVSWLVSGIQICGWFRVMSNFLFVKYKLIWRIIWGIAIGWDDLLHGSGQTSIYPSWTDNQLDLTVYRFELPSKRSPMGQCSGLEAGWKLRKVFSLRTTSRKECESWKSLVFFKCELFLFLFVLLCVFCFQKFPDFYFYYWWPNMATRTSWFSK